MANPPKGLRDVGGNLFKDASGNTYLLSSDRVRILKLADRLTAMFQLYRSRLVMAATIFLVMGYYGGNWILGAAIGMLVFAVFEIFFHTWMIPRMGVYKTLKKPYPKSGLIAGVSQQRKENLLRTWCSPSSCARSLAGIFSSSAKAASRLVTSTVSSIPFSLR